MPSKRRSLSPFDPFDDELDEDSSSQGSKSGNPANPPIQRNAANARERARMRVLSRAFGRLKTKLPQIPPDTKLSKLDTLRLATKYIRQLKTLVETGATPSDNEANIGVEHDIIFNAQRGAQSMTWPFGFHHITNTSRQLAFQYSTMDWCHTPDNYGKYSHQGPASSEQFSLIQQQQLPQQQPLNSNHWYTNMDTSTADVHNSSSCVYDLNVNQQHHPQNQRIHHTQALQTHH